MQIVPYTLQKALTAHLRESSDSSRGTEAFFA